MAATGDKYTIKALDSIIGAITPELRSKILNQIPSKTKQLASNLQLAEGERTEIALNARADDGITNGANNIIKKITLSGLDISARPLAQASVKSVGRVQITDHSPVWRVRFFIAKKLIKLQNKRCFLYSVLPRNL